MQVDIVYLTSAVDRELRRFVPLMVESFDADWYLRFWCHLREAVRTVPFGQVVCGLFCCGFSMNLLGTHGVPMLMDHGFDAMTSSYGIGLIGVVAIFGTLVLGRYADTLPRRGILAAIYFVRGVGFFALVVVGTHWELYLAASLGGLVRLS